MSSDVRMLLPLLVAIMMAKWVADSLTHPLYHGLLEIKCIPFLNAEPQASKHLDLLPVARVMASPVVTLGERERLGTVWEALRHTQHNGFPVVRASPHGQVTHRRPLLWLRFLKTPVSACIWLCVLQYRVVPESCVQAPAAAD